MLSPPAFRPGKTLAFLLLLLAGVIAGCGQKGDLYLPDDPQAPKFNRAG